MANGERTEQAWELQRRGFSYSEIARAMNVTRGTIGVLIRCARVKRGLATNPWRATKAQGYDDHEPDGTQDETPGCPRCHLRTHLDKTPHVCLPDRADPYARRGVPYYVRNKTS